jgi:type II secretion system protein E
VTESGAGSATVSMDSLGALTLTPRDLETLVPLSDRFTPAYLEHHRVLPVRRNGRALVVATWGDPSSLDGQALDDLRFVLDVDELALVEWPEAPLRQAIRRAYSGVAVTAEGVIAGLAAAPAANGAPGGELALDDLVSLANEAPVVKLVNLLLLEALESRASDVHLEHYADGLRVRYRIDGVLQDAPAPPLNLASALASRLKIMADLDISERRIPQDGRIRLKLQDRQVDVRVSIVPTLNGESVVLRLLDKAHGRISLEQLGMGAEMLASFRRAISRPHGIVLATGPTGSGKTTTLYAAIDLIRTGREKILTVEDPVEYELHGVPQVPVNEKVGVTFASALRALLRQDPDVVLVGEIRDPETAEIAIQAALTGHLVLSTLHTNDAVSAVTRLLDLGVAPFLVASTLEAVLAQRLVRKVCESCAKAERASEAEALALGSPAQPLREVRRGAGCADCRGTGYRGRTGIYELLTVTDAVKNAIGNRMATGDLARVACEAGMRTLRAHGEALVREGVTSPEEVLRVTREAPPA